MSTATVEKAGQGRGSRRGLAALEPIFYLLPIIILLCTFVVFPIGRSVWLSMNEASLLGGINGFVGSENFATIFADPRFWHYIRVSLTWTFGAVALQFTFGMIGALLLNNKFPLRGVVRGLVMIPWATPSVLVALMWMWLLDPNHGLINRLIMGLGFIDAPVQWLSNPDTALPSLIMVDVWQGIPFFAVMILAALQSVPKDVVEAGRVDGCSALQVFWHVTVPHIVPTIMVTLLLRIIWTANYVDLAFILTGGGPAEATTTVPLQAYLTAYKSGDFGVGSAYAMVQAAFLMIFVIIYVRLSNKTEENR
ncbi:sugar ABC transporter permease [Propionimicrobium sp. PCR01-08-3]|uniref:carbohydrate ABC transporter permease n=1 Tax=Propionimicrobium sp. PCR01-08-3 TaxID=3052086 RepID=UPI00255CA519|nr:sugar ABC transporter permease [Propionimicrobium sp. PCR01-08-3]WIY83484.1 sugar ABC transporter permease [Propionimicrobium sp. PCR01-08-3]